MVVKNRFALLGSSRGLGWTTYQLLRQSHPDSSFLLASRKIVDRKSQVAASTKLVVEDFSVLPVNHIFFEKLKDFKPTVLFYFAGGGPYGFFEEKSWSSHLWSLNTTFLYPAQLLHSVLAHPWPELKQMVFIGSAVAEEKPDPMACSYSSAKHGLKGLIDSVNAEKKQRSFKISLFSPGYMQTDLIPKQSEAFQRAESTEVVAQRLLELLK